MDTKKILEAQIDVLVEMQKEKDPNTTVMIAQQIMVICQALMQK